ncbi:MATE family efflux transporter [Mediterraneibacter glycyrrhizinilyticus]|nr:MATE family efflux transporter [Mediterraneibacter glycyrrhizinilyticus]MBM6852616.1 MATE family efflux transporter [Mediterraneibacter glycyrrhizinilyticus]
MDNRLFREKLLSLVLPITFQQLMVTVVSASGALMVGVIGQDMLSAVSLASQITFVYNLFTVALTIGTSMFAAQYWGKGDKDAVERILGIVLRTSAAVSVVFFAGTAVFPGMLMRIFTPDPALIGYGSEYLRIVSVTYLMCGVSQIYLCIMKNSDLAAKSMVIGSTAALLNIVLNAVLIYGLFGAPRMEAAGAAAATAVSRAVELVWGGGFTMYSVIMGHMGTDAVAANSIANIVKNIIASLAMGIGNGGAIIVGNELGAGRLEQVRLYGGRLCRISILSGICSGIFLLLISPLVLAATDLSPEAAEYLKWMLVMCSYYMVGKYVNGTTIAGIFCAGGDSRFGFLCDTVTLWCFTVPAGFLAAFVFRLPVLAVYFIINLDEIVKLPAVYRRYKKYAWLKDLTVEPRQEQG